MSVEAYLNGKKVEPGRFEEVNMCGSMFEQAKSIKDQIANGLKLRGLYPDFVDRIPEEPQPCCCEPDMTAEYAANKAKYEAERDAPNELFRKLDDPYERARLQEGRETDIYVRRHADLCRELNTIFEKKNTAYGDSFFKTFDEEGWAMPRIRLSDKLNRFKTLTRNPDISEGDESIRDTLMDLANYALMTILAMED